MIYKILYLPKQLIFFVKNNLFWDLFFIITYYMKIGSKNVGINRKLLVITSKITDL